MKRLLIVISAFLISTPAFLQGIDFYHGTWEEALKESRVQGKLIFVDAFTTWCGPCKRMAKYVFPDPEVGEFYNANFINMKLDMERGEGLKFRQQYTVTAYPTFFYINPDGEVVYTTKGARQAPEFIQLGKTALSKYDGSKQYEAEYEAGERGYEFMLKYVRELNRASKPSLKVANDYLNSKPDITEEQRLMFIKEAAIQVDSRLFAEMLENEKAIVKLIGKEEWESTIRSAAKLTAERARDYESPGLIDQATKVMEDFLPDEAAYFSQRAFMDYALAYRSSDLYGKYAKQFVKKTAEDDPKALIQVAQEVIRYFPNNMELVDIADMAAFRALKVEESVEAYMAYATVCIRKGEKEKALGELEKGIKFAEESKQSDKNLQALKRMIENS